ncbi:MAG: DUF4340 domain-containing protein [Candidatus Poribacteria bacterium]
MKAKTTIILLLIFIVLFALVYAFEIRKPKDTKKDSKKVEVVLEIPESEINKIEIAYTMPKIVTLIANKDDKGVWKSQMAGIKGDDIQKAIENALGRYVFDTVKDTVSLSEYGLDNPKVAVSFYFKDGTKKKIMIGNEVPIGNYVYVQEESKPDIYMIPASILEDWTKLISDTKQSI